MNSGIDRWRKARKKPVEVEFRGPYTDTDTIQTIEGDFEVDDEYIEDHEGYVIIRGVEGEVYPCGLDIFRETYEQVIDDREDAEWVKESVIKDARETGGIVVSGAWAASPVEGKDKIDIFRFDHSVRKEAEDDE